MQAAGSARTLPPPSAGANPRRAASRYQRIEWRIAQFGWNRGAFKRFIPCTFGMERFFVKGERNMKIIDKFGVVSECPKEEELHVLRHTAAHIMAQAIKRL